LKSLRSPEEMKSASVDPGPWNPPVTIATRPVRSCNLTRLIIPPLRRLPPFVVRGRPCFSRGRPFSEVALPPWCATFAAAAFCRFRQLEFPRPLFKVVQPGIAFASAAVCGHLKNMKDVRRSRRLLPSAIRDCSKGVATTSRMRSEHTLRTSCHAASWSARSTGTSA